MGVKMNDDTKRYDSLTFAFGQIDEHQVVVMKIETKQGERLEVGMSGQGLAILRDTADRYLTRHPEVRQWKSLPRH